MTEIDLEALLSTTAGNGFGITPEGFIPKSVARLLDEKIAAARVLFGNDIDLTSGSVTRKWLEMVTLEEARVWEHLGNFYADTYPATATGDALSMLGQEIGVPRPHHRATGSVTIKLDGDLPNGIPSVRLDRGTRLLTLGGHDYFTTAATELSAAVKSADVSVMAFTPGPAMNLNPADPNQVLNSFNEYDQRSDIVRHVASVAGSSVVVLHHTTASTGGEHYWSDETYRDLLLAYPRNLWTPDAIRTTIALVPGVRQAVVNDRFGGLDINQSIFGNFSFAERLFSEERSLGEPYYFTVLVAPGAGAIWDGPGQLRERVREAVDRVRPVGILPKIEQAALIGIGMGCIITVGGLPIPGGTPKAVNDSPEAVDLKGRIFDRIRRYVQGLSIGEPVRYAEVLWAIMEEPGVIDAKQLRLRRYPPTLAGTNFAASTDDAVQEFVSEQDVPISPGEIADLVDSLELLVIR